MPGWATSLGGRDVAILPVWWRRRPGIRGSSGSRWAASRACPGAGPQGQVSQLGDARLPLPTTLGTPQLAHALRVPVVAAAPSPRELSLSQNCPISPQSLSPLHPQRHVVSGVPLALSPGSVVAFFLLPRQSFPNQKEDSYKPQDLGENVTHADFRRVGTKMPQFCLKLRGQRVGCRDRSCTKCSRFQTVTPDLPPVTRSVHQGSEGERAPRPRRWGAAWVSVNHTAEPGGSPCALGQTPRCARLAT